MTGIPLKYNLRNLLVRKVTSGMTLCGIALVVATFVSLMAMARGLDRSLVIAGRPDGAVVLRKGAITDAASSVAIAEYQVLREVPQVLRDPDGSELASPELVLQVARQKKSGEEASVTLRGVRPIAFRLHERVKVAAGRALAVRGGEMLVGKGLQARYQSSDSKLPPPDSITPTIFQDRPNSATVEPSSKPW